MRRHVLPLRFLSLLPIALVLLALAFTSRAGWLHADEGDAAGGAVIRVPSSTSVSAGNDVTINVTVQGASQGVGGYEFALVYNAAVLTFEAVDNGPFLSSTGRTTFCPQPVFDRNLDGTNDAGFIRFGCGTTGATPGGPTGSGTLASIRFGTSCSGSTALSFDIVGLSTVLGDDIAVSAQGGSVSVSGGSSCGPPVTPPPPPPPPGGLRGDVNCDGQVTSIDAALILQRVARRVSALPCLANGDANRNGMVDAIDALLVLQDVAGLISL